MNLFFKRKSLINIYNKQLFGNIIKIAPLIVGILRSLFLDLYELYMR